MLEQLNNAVKFLAFFTASKQGKTGLTVTVDVYNPAGTAIVSAATATALGGGLYSYTLASGSVTTEGEYAAIFKTADTTVDMQHIPSLWVVGRAGVEDLDATVSSRSNITAANVRAEMDANSTKLANLDTTVSSRLATSGYTAPASAAAIAQAVWEYLTSGVTAVGSFGKLLKDQLDAAVSSRLAGSSYVAPTTPPTVVQIRSELDANSTKLANLDATVSSRLATSGYTAPASAASIADAVWNRLTSAITTASSIGKLLVDNINATISSRLASAGYVAPTTPPTVAQIRQEIDTNSTKLDVAVSTRLAGSSYVAPAAAPTVAAIRAGLPELDNLDVAVSTRLADADYVPGGGSGSGLTTEQAALLENLDAPVSSRATAADLAVTVSPTPVTVNPTPVTVNPTPVTVDGGFTSADRAKLAHLDADISSRAAPADVQVTVSGAGLTAEQAAQLSTLVAEIVKLDVAVSTRATAADVTVTVPAPVVTVDPQAPTAAEIADAVWDESAVDHDIPNTTGRRLAGAAAAGDPWQAQVPGDYGIGTAGWYMGKLNFGAVKVNIVSPLQTNGDLTVVRGDDYRTADGRAILFADNGGVWPSLTGAAVKWIARSRHDGSKVEADATVLDTNTVSLELPATKTGLLSIGGEYTYTLEATIATRRLTLVAGKLTVSRGA